MRAKGIATPASASRLAISSRSERTISALARALVCKEVLGGDFVHLPQYRFHRSYERLPVERGEPALIKNCEFLFGGLMVKFKFPFPFPPDRTRAATPRNISRHRRKVIQEVVEVGILIEIVAAAIRHDAPIENMYLANRPSVEARLREEFL